MGVANRSDMVMNRETNKSWLRGSMMVLAFLATVLLTAISVFGAGSSSVLGRWQTDGNEFILELFKCEKNICGKVVWLNVPKYIDSNDGPVGQIKVDRKNPNPSLRTRPILGLQVIQGLTVKDSMRWENGTCYNPVSGISYKCNMRQVSAERLELRGYIGISLFGRTSGLSRSASIVK